MKIFEQFENFIKKLKFVKHFNIFDQVLKCSKMRKLIEKIKKMLETDGNFQTQKLEYFWEKAECFEPELEIFDKAGKFPMW